jgi:photosystem II stability/assembly factor-like uncharacterized protein
MQAESGLNRNAWVQAGPDNIGARVTDLALHPTQGNIVYAAMASGGVFRSVDTGANWEPIFDDQPSLSVGSVALDPQNPERIYVGTGEANAASLSFFGTGLYRSLDEGQSWEYSGLEETRYIARIAVDPGDSNRIFAAGTGSLFSPDPHRGVYRSEDGGDSWSLVFSLTDSTSCIDLVINPQNPDEIYAAMWERMRGLTYRRSGGPSSGIWRSQDGGESWSELSSGLPTDSHVGRIGLALCAESPDILYAIYADDSSYFDGVYKSSNGGDSWSRCNDSSLSGMYSSYGWWFGNIRVHPSDPNQVYALGLYFYRSQNGGQSWSEVGGNMHVDHHAMAFVPGSPHTIFNGNDGGLYRSGNGGDSWTKLGNQPTSQFYAIEVDYQNPERLYGGTQDNGTLRTLSGATDDWERILGGDGFTCIVDPGNANRIYAEYQYGGLCRSTNGGSSFSSATSGISGSDRRNWSTPVVLDPNNSQTMYYGSYRLYRSLNGASSWSAISGDLTGGNHGANFGTITTIAVAPSNSSVIYAGTDDAKVWRSTDGGTNWDYLADSLPERWVTRIAVDPYDEDIAYISYSGLRWDEAVSHVFCTTNGGTSWTDISGNLPELPVSVILVDPDFPSRLYVGTDLGCYFSDGGTFWQALGSGLPNVPVLDLKLHEPTRTLIAGTHGRSMFRLELQDPTEAADTAPLQLQQNYPNPFNPKTEIRFDLEKAGLAKLRIYDSSGRWVRSLLEGSLPAGEHRLHWDGRDHRGRDCASGTYFYRLDTGVKQLKRKMLLIR